MEVSLNREAESFTTSENKYELSALIGADSFFYGLFDPDARLVASGNPAYTQSSLSTTVREVTSGQVKKAKVAYISTIVMLLPNIDYRPQDISAILQHTRALDDPDAYIFRADRPVSYDFRVCYAIPKTTLHSVKEVFDTPTLSHFLTVYLDRIDAADDYGLHICILNTCVVVVAVKDGYIGLSNVYASSDTTTTFYHINHVYKSQYSGEDVPIWLSGTGDKDKELIELMKGYFHKVSEPYNPLLIPGSQPGDKSLFYPLYCILSS